MTAVRRQIKNVVGNYTDIQVKVREATSNDPWGPSGALMGEIADATYNRVEFLEIMGMLWRRLNDHGKNWRHVYKALTVLEYIVKTGSDEVARYCRDQLFSIQTLKDFQFVDKDGKDQGFNVREKSKNLVALLKDDDRLEEERRKGKEAKERFAKVRGDASGSNTTTPRRRGSLGSSPAGKSSSSTNTSSSPTSQSWQPPRKNDPSPTPASELAQSKPRDRAEEALQLELAMALSREEAEKDRRMRAAEDSALSEALSQSRAQATTDGASDPWGAPTAAAASNDPWGGSSSTASAPAAPPASDLWGGTSSGSRQDAASPWGNTSAPTLHQQAAAPTSSSPWGDPAPPAQTDPWGSSAKADPFAPRSTTPKDMFTPTSDFGSSNGFSPRSGSPSVPFSQPLQPTQTSDPFNVNRTADGVSAMSLMQQQPRKPETVEKKFLGQNSGLVNLDSLAGPPPPANPSPALSNPFAMGSPSLASTGGVRQLTSNPFQKEKPQAKSLNQMKTHDFSSPSHVQGGGDLLPAPLIPDTSAQPAVNAGPNITPGPTIPPAGWGAAPNPMMAPGMPPQNPMMAAGMQPMAPGAGMGYGMGMAPMNSSNPFKQW